MTVGQTQAWDEAAVASSLEMFSFFLRVPSHVPRSV